MRKRFSIMLTFFLFAGAFISGNSYADKPSSNVDKIYSGFFSREVNDGKMAQTSGNNHYIKFYPENRIIRLYIPYPYSKSVKPETIIKAFNSAEKKSSGSAYIRDKFGVMDELVVAHLDFYRWIDKQLMYDCGKPKPCKITFDDKFLTVIKPGIVVEHKIRYDLVNH